MEQDNRGLNDLSYEVIRDRYRDGTLSVDAAFHATMRLMDDSGFGELGFTQAIQNTLSFLEAPDSKRIERNSPLLPVRSRDAKSHVDRIKYNASKYDGVHPNPQQDDLMSILRNLGSLSEDKSLWRIDRDSEGNVIPHEADERLPHDRIVMEPDVAKVFARKAEKQKEVTDRKESVINGFKRELLDGIFLPHQRPWSSHLKSDTSWIRENLEGGSEVVDNMARISTELSKVGYMMENYGDDIEEVVAIFSRMPDMGIKEIAAAPEYQT